MNPNLEEMTIFTTASIRKFLLAAGIGVPVTFLQLGDKGDDAQKDEVQILMSLQFPDRGGKNELYGIVNVQAIVKTKIVPSDVFYHTRIKARVVETLNKVIPLQKIGGEETGQNGVKYDKSKWGILRRLPSQTITITPTSIDVPDASLVEAFYEIQPC